MNKLFVFLFVGFFAQLIDGSLGMAYGSTSTSLLLTYGVAPAIASSSVHIAEIVTTGVSGLSHLKLGNVDKKLVFRLIIPGALGAFTGACFLSRLPGDLIKPYISILLVVLGIYIILKYFLNVNLLSVKTKLSNKKLLPLGLVAGFVDSIGGGGWGTIATPFLLTQPNMSPRKVIGSVDSSEFIVTIASSAGFLLSIGSEHINWSWVFILMAGGLLAAPLAAWLVRVLPTQLLGVFVGGIIVLTNTRIILTTWETSKIMILLIYGLILITFIVLPLSFKLRK
ncbi:sulfite exporter TauE/SafE family protein [Scopulibacillus cellulosilyticus]|uniref:Probable membrane transporter protein n=1 Tax=Scopulibacillus cellulosilyticus TaxID=2665665 RepID=A0ABW2Q0Y9_9BACL